MGGHWGIVNCLHWVRDVVFGEDVSQVRTGSVPQLLAAMRDLVTGMLRLCGVKNILAALRHHAWKRWETLTLIGLPTDNQKPLELNGKTLPHSFRRCYNHARPAILPWGPQPHNGSR